MARKPRGVAKPSEMTTEEAVRMCRESVTVPDERYGLVSNLLSGTPPSPAPK